MRFGTATATSASRNALPTGVLSVNALKKCSAAATVYARLSATVRENSGAGRNEKESIDA